MIVEEPNVTSMRSIITKIDEIRRIRKDVPQFLFASDVFPMPMYKVRKAVTEFKRDNDSCEEIDFIIHSPGGFADDAYRIITTLRKNFTTVNIVIPFWAKSAATLLSLGASKLIFSQYGELGPLDVQLGKERDDSPEFERESALNDDQSIKIIEEHFKIMYETMFIQIYEHKKIKISKTEVSRQLLSHIPKLYEPMLRQINPYKLGDKRRKLNIAIEYANRILVMYGEMSDPEEIRGITNFLVDGFPDHGTVIDFELMSTLLPNCYTGKIFGDEYNNAINDLSLMFISNEDAGTRFVGFITDDVVKSTNPDKSSSEQVFVNEEETEGGSDNDDIDENDDIVTPTDDQISDSDVETE